MEKDFSATMHSSKSCIFKSTFLHSDGNILDETQRLIEEAELKLRSMEAGINLDTNFTSPNVFSSIDHFTCNDLKNHRLKQALDSKMKKLEKELEAHQKNQVAASDSADAVGDSGTVTAVDVHDCKRAQRGRVRRPCRKSPTDSGPQDVVDVVRTARDSVHGALVAARKLSATLDNRTPRASLSQQSARVPSIQTPTDIQPTDSESARFCSEHGTKRKVCSCLRTNYEGLKPERRKRGNSEDAPFVSVNVVTTKSNVGIFQAKCTSVKQGIGQPQKRLQMAVMPPVSIKRSLEKQVMPEIHVPFPGSNPDTAKRENTCVKSFKHVDPQECAQKCGASYVQRDGSKILSKAGINTSSSVASADGHPADSSVVRQFSSMEELREMDNSQLKQTLEFLLKKMTSSQTRSSPKVSHHRSGLDTFTSSKLDRPNDRHSEKSNFSSGSSQHVLKDESPGTSDESGGIAYDSLSRFVETYSKAAVGSKRAKQKAVERRKEEERSMKAQEQRFKNASAENQRNEANHALIGPFRRAILKGRLRTCNDLASTSNQIGEHITSAATSNQTGERTITVPPDNGSSETVDVKISLGGGEPKDFDKGTPRQSKATVEDFSARLKEEKNLGGEADEQKEAFSQSSAQSKSIAEPKSLPHIAPAESSLKTEESSNDEYEDDWEEENEGEKVAEENVETRDVGDGSERESHDEPTDGLVHTLRTIMEVEENSSLSLSLVHHEPVSQPSQSGANKSGIQSTPKSLTEADHVKALPTSQTEKSELNNSATELVLAKSPVETVIPADQHRTEEFSSSRAFVEMTEALKKMLETVVSNVVQNKPSEEGGVDRHDSKRLGVRFEGAVNVHDRRGIRRYDPLSSGSANDDRFSSGSEASYSRSIWNRNRSHGRRVRFKTGNKRSSATQTEADEDLKRDAETQITPDKGNSERGRQDDLFLRPSKLSLLRLPLRSSRPISLNFNDDPTARLLAFGRHSYQFQSLPAYSGINLSPEPEGGGSVSQCDSLTSSCSSVLPIDGGEYPANNTIMSLSEGEVLAYHSCSCSEGEVCLCAGRGRKGRDQGSKSSDPIPGEPVLAGSAPLTPNPWSTLNSTATENLMDLSDHFSEGEVIEKLIGISHLLNNKTRDETF